MNKMTRTEYYKKLKNAIALANGGKNYERT